jgi:hypothetical protein
LCLFTMLFSSCLKDNNNYVAPSTALLMVVQGSPDAPAENLFLNTNLVNSQPLNYQDFIGYFNAYTGNRTVILSNSSTQAMIASDTINLKANLAYSLFLANTYTKPDFILLKDTINTPASGKAAIRLVNASPDAGSVDLAVNNTVLVAGRSYKGASSFLPVTGNMLCNFSLLAHGTSTVLAKLDSVNVYTGSVYTIWLHGLASGSGTTKLTAGIIQNANF